MEVDRHNGRQDERLTPDWPDPTPGTLTQRVVAASVWVLGLHFGERLLGLARMIVLARLLAPDDFGLFGIALLALSVVDALSRTGFQEALIQRSDDIAGFLDTAWTTQILRGFLLSIALWLVAPGVAAFFGEPSAVFLLRVLSLNMALLGFTNVGLVFFPKELEYRKYVYFSLSGALVDFVVSIVAAILLRDAWALVYGVLAGNLVRTMISHIVAPPVRPGFEWEKFKQLAGFGSWVWGSNVLHFLLNEGDDVVVGKMLGAYALGLYRMAFVYANLPATEITHVVSKVTFPAYSKLQHDLPRLREGFLRALRATAVVSAPLAGGIFVMAPSFVRLVLGDQWLPMILPMQVLALWGFVRSIGATIGSVFQGIGRPDIITKLALVRLVTLAALIFPLTHRWGLVGTSVAVTGAALLDYPLASFIVVRLLACGARNYVSAWIYPLAATSIMVAVLLTVHRILGPVLGLSAFFFSLGLGASLYAVLMLIFQKLFRYDLAGALGRKRI